MPRFAPDRLRALAGDAAFGRGEALLAAGAVTLLSAGSAIVLAVVRGGEDYRVRLRGQGPHIAGDCTCPAFDREGWCKHLVATALAADAAGEAVPDRQGAIRAHLVGLGAPALADMLLDLATRDIALLRRLDLAASAADKPAAEHAALLRQALRDALHPRHFVDYDAAGNWTDEILQTLAQVPALIAAGAAAEAKDLLDSVLDELPGALEQVDDSDGGGTDVLERVAALHVEACRALRPDPLTLAAELFERAWDSDGFGTFDTADETYAEILGEAGLAEYRRLAEAAYASLPPIGRDGADAKAADRRQLTMMLDRFAARAGDVDRRIVLRRAVLADARDHLALARFCLEHGRPDMARETARDGVFLFDDATGTALVLFLADRLVAEGRRDEAIATLWRGFERAPALGLFSALHGLGAPDAADRALAMLRSRRATMRGVDHWRIRAMVELQIGILMEAARLAEAWAITREVEVGDTLLLRLADASARHLPDQAARVYSAVLERRIGETSRGGYEDACRLLVRLAALQPRADHAAYVGALRVRHRMKRSLLPMLDRHLAEQGKVSASG
jgi:hypothetical protein